MEIINSGLFHAWKNNPQGKGLQISNKLYSQAKSFYESVDETLTENTVMYEVYTIPSKPEAGHLSWGLSVLKPVYVNGECNMTRGHFHENLECEEYYWCQAGEGLLMLMDEDGKCWCEEMKEGTLHHIDGHHAHRLINTSDVDLEVVCIWNGDAGHDYARVEQMPFPVRIYKVEGKIQIKEG
ncbi:MAG: ectoine synthase [Holdemanella sp.]|nr:ectoine synthase [Holdemanella sp.]